MSATILNSTLVDVLAFKSVAVQSGEDSFFLLSWFNLEGKRIVIFSNLQPCSQEHSKVPGRFVQEPEFLEIVKYFWSTVYRHQYKHLNLGHYLDHGKYTNI